MSLSFIVPTSGRATLARTLASIASQIEQGDEILVYCDKSAKWGNSSRDRMMEQASGTHLLFIDDDDAYADGALELVRKAVAEWPEHIHVFRMRSPRDNDPWNGQEVKPGNLATPMLVWPNVGPFPPWAADDSGVSDFRFIEQSIRNLKRELIWHEEVLAIVRPE